MIFKVVTIDEIVREDTTQYSDLYRLDSQVRTFQNHFSDVIETMQDENLIPKSNYPDLTQRNPVTYRAPLASNTAENNISTTRQIGKSPNVLATRVRRERSRQEFPIENF